ncbi:MAG: bifunctional DNA-formamidopyrimidine glycosylase/DNA-(apurinic or apyrimidinic site) lyase [Mariprofundales bacterium]
MPELPEVEVVRQHLQTLLLKRRVTKIAYQRSHLRYPVPDLSELIDQYCTKIHRRGKYLCFSFMTSNVKNNSGNHNHNSNKPQQILHVLWHLGMSGQLHVLPKNTVKTKHEHIRIVFDDEHCLCYRDARRFGYIGLIPAGEDVYQHPWLVSLGIEPLSDDFTAEVLYKHCQGRKRAIKTLLMDAHIIVGIGNIYAAEALFCAGIHPATLAKMLNIADCERLVPAIRDILQRAIAAGGSTIRDFVHADGKPGYFAYQFCVYGRDNQPCLRCETPIIRMRHFGRSSFYCPQCQPHFECGMSAD